MATVYKREGETLDSMIKRFKKLVVSEGILEDYRKHEFYVAPSLKKRLKHEEAMKREKKFNKV